MPLSHLPSRIISLPLFLLAFVALLTSQSGCHPHYESLRHEESQQVNSWGLSLDPPPILFVSGHTNVYTDMTWDSPTEPRQPWIRGDFDFDGVVTYTDLILVRKCLGYPDSNPWEGAEVYPHHCWMTDLNQDGSVNFVDLSITRNLLSDFPSP